MGDLNYFAQWIKDKGFFFKWTWKFSWTGWNEPKRKPDLPMAKRINQVEDKTKDSWDDIRQEIKGGDDNG